MRVLNILMESLYEQKTDKHEMKFDSMGLEVLVLKNILRGSKNKLPENL